MEASKQASQNHLFDIYMIGTEPEASLFSRTHVILLLTYWEWWGYNNYPWFDTFDCINLHLWKCRFGYFRLRRSSENVDKSDFNHRNFITPSLNFFFSSMKWIHYIFSKLGVSMYHLSKVFVVLLVFPMMVIIVEMACLEFYFFGFVQLCLIRRKKILSVVMFFIFEFDF